MAYYLQLNENYAVYRSRHTGQIGLWERNTLYNYWAAREYLPVGQKLTLRVLDRWAVQAGTTAYAARRAYTDMVRAGGNGMKPLPDFSLAETSA